MPTTAPSTDAIRARLAALLPELRERYAVCSLSIFGSYARGEQTPESDLDVLVAFDASPTLYTLGGLQLDLKEALGLDVHLSHEQTLRPAIRERVQSERLPVGA